MGKNINLDNMPLLKCCFLASLYLILPPVVKDLILARQDIITQVLCIM